VYTLVLQNVMQRVMHCTLRELTGELQVSSLCVSVAGARALPHVPLGYALLVMAAAVAVGAVAWGNI
jgi:hypothetical protein